MCAKWQWNARDCVTGLHDRRSRECNPLTPVECVSMSFRTHPRILAFITHIMYKRNWDDFCIGRAVPLLKPPQSPHCYLGEVDHAKIFPPPLATRQARSYRANWATQTLLFSKPFDLAQVCHENKICSKPALTWKLTLVLAFPAHCISN